MKLMLAALILLLSACSSPPQVPQWQMNAHDSLGHAVLAYLEGNSAVAEVEFARARDELSRTARPDWVARSELTRCAARIASLDLQTCAAYAALAVDASVREQSYAAFLRGEWNGLDPARLPPQYQTLLGAADAAAQLKSLEDPLSRLIAAGVLLQRARLTDEGIATAVETASAQGWRRPLLAWLKLQQQRAQQAGRADEVARMQRRIELLSDAFKP